MGFRGFRVGVGVRGRGRGRSTARVPALRGVIVPRAVHEGRVRNAEPARRPLP